MAYVANFDDEDENQPGQSGSEQIASGSAPTSSSSGSSGGSSSSKGGAKGWTNLQNYVSANAGADQGMASAVESGANDAAKAVGEKQNTYGRESQAAINAGTNQDRITPPKPSTGIQVGERSASAGGIQVGSYDAQAGGTPAPKQKRIIKSSTMAQRATPPVSVAQINAAKQQASGSYTGPGSAAAAAGYGETGDAVGDFVGLAKGAQDFNGRIGLLDDAFGRPSYTRGEKRLDSFLLGAGDAGRQTMSKIDNLGKTAGQGWTDLQATLDGEIKNAQEASVKNADLGRQTLSGYKGKVVGAINDVDTKRKAVAASEADKTQRITAGLASRDPNVRGRIFKELGVDPSWGEQFLAQGGTPVELYQQSAGPSLRDVLDPATLEAYKAILDGSGNSSIFDLDSVGGGDGRGHVTSGARSAEKDFQKRAIEEAARKREDERRMAEAKAKQEAAWAKLSAPSTAGTFTEQLANKQNPIPVLADGETGAGTSVSANDAKPGPDGMEVFDFLKDIGTVGQQGASGTGIKDDLDDPAEWWNFTKPYKPKFY